MFNQEIMKNYPIEHSLITAQTFVSKELGYDFTVVLEPETENAKATSDRRSIIFGEGLIKQLEDDAHELYGSIIDIIGVCLGQKLTIDNVFKTTIELITAHEVGHILRKHPRTTLAWLEFTDELAHSLYAELVERQELDPQYYHYFVQQAKCQLSEQIREIDADTQAIRILSERRDRVLVICAIMLNRYTTEKLETKKEKSYQAPFAWYFPEYHQSHPRADIRLFSEMQVLTVDSPLTEPEQEVVKLIEQNAERGECRFKLCCSEILDKKHRELYKKLHESWKLMDQYIESNISNL